jgi:hypothetical protein
MAFIFVSGGGIELWLLFPFREIYFLDFWSSTWFFFSYFSYFFSTFFFFFLLVCKAQSVEIAVMTPISISRLGAVTTPISLFSYFISLRFSLIPSFLCSRFLAVFSVTGDLVASGFTWRPLLESENTEMKE